MMNYYGINTILLHDDRAATILPSVVYKYEILRYSQCITSKAAVCGLDNPRLLNFTAFTIQTKRKPNRYILIRHVTTTEPVIPHH